MNQSLIRIIGAGELGQALAGVLRPTGVTVRLWDTDSARSDSPGPLADQGKGASPVFYCAPAATLRQGLAQLAPSMTGGIAILSKGLEQGTGKTTAQVADESLPAQLPYALLGGPFLAEELAEGGSAMAATKDDRLYAQLKTLFKATPVRLERSRDTQGVAVAGVTKNIYALLLGMADGLGCGSNLRAGLLTGMAHEMSRLCADLGGTAETALTLAGLGDLLATGLSPHSANFQAGRRLVTLGDPPCSRSEGALALASLSGLVSTPSDYPYLYAALRACTKNEPPQAVIAELIG